MISFDAESGALVRCSAVDDELLAKFGISPENTFLPKEYRTESRCKYLRWHNAELARRDGQS